MLALLLAPFALAILIGIVLTGAAGYPERSGGDIGFGQHPVDGTVRAASAASCSGGPESPGEPECIELQIELDEGETAGATIRQVQPDEPSTPRFSVGDPVVLAYTGGDPRAESSYQVVDFQRGMPLFWLAALFVAAVVLLGRWKGLASLAALGFSFGVLVLYILPAILDGSDPVLVAVLGSGAIMLGTLYLSHGISAQTSTAVVGTMVSLALIGVLGSIFTEATRLTGLDSDSANLISVLDGEIDARGLLLAGIIIGALGVLDDVTVTQTSVVWELRRANPALTVRQLYSAALRVGRDHLASAVNTLALAYAGAALPVLLAFSVSGQGFGTLLTAQDVAQEIVRTLVGSIGLVAAIPITSLVAAVVARQDAVRPID